MKFSVQTLIVLLASSTQAFTIGSRRHAAVRQSTTTLSMSSEGEDKIAALRAAAAKARADAERLREVRIESWYFGVNCCSNC
jgi:hypothetical protein